MNEITNQIESVIFQKFVDMNNGKTPMKVTDICKMLAEAVVEFLILTEKDLEERTIPSSYSVTEITDQTKKPDQ